MVLAAKFFHFNRIITENLYLGRCVRLFGIIKAIKAIKA